MKTACTLEAQVKMKPKFLQRKKNRKVSLYTWAHPSLCNEEAPR